MNWLNGGTLFVQAAQWFNPEDLPPSYPPPGFSSNNPNPHFESPVWVRKNDQNFLKIIQEKEKKLEDLEKNWKFWRKGYFIIRKMANFKWVISYDPYGPYDGPYDMAFNLVATKNHWNS